MDEEEIDAKYEEEKELLMDAYLAELEKGADKDATAEHFQKKFNKIHEAYKKRMNKALWQKSHPPLFKQMVAKLQSKLPQK